MARLPLAILLGSVLLPTLWRARPPPAPRPCAPEGRGVAPREWVGCAGDPGTPRDLGGAERLALGLPVDVNRATAEDLAGVPGVGARLAGAVVADRAARGPFEGVDDLARVKGIGPARLARARPYLSADPWWRRNGLRPGVALRSARPLDLP